MQNRTSDGWLLNCILVLFPGSLRPRSPAESESGGLQRKDCFRMALYFFAWLFNAIHLFGSCGSRESFHSSGVIESNVDLPDRHVEARVE